jgi:hypothetical protein
MCTCTVASIFYNTRKISIPVHCPINNCANVYSIAVHYKYCGIVFHCCTFIMIGAQIYAGWNSERGTDHELDWSSKSFTGTLFFYRWAQSLGCDAIHVRGLLPSYNEIFLSWGFWWTCYCNCITRGSQSSCLSPCPRAHT